MATEVKVYTPTLVDLCASQALKTPIFQRPYGWMPEKAVEYLRDFLTNRKANNLFGSVFGYCETPWSKANPGDNELFVTDGQHRLVTSAVVAIALLAERDARLKEAEGCSDLSEDTQDALHELRSNLDHVEMLSKIASANLEFMVDEDGTVANLKAFLAETDAQIKTLETKIEKSRLHLGEVKKSGSGKWIPRAKHARLVAKRNAEGLTREETQELADIEEHIRQVQAERAAIQEAIRATRDEVAGLRAEVTKITAVPLYAAYLGVRQHLGDLSLSALNRQLSVFAERQSSFSIALLILEPKGNSVVERVVLDDQAAEIFAQINGQTRPLTSPELLNSLFRSFRGFQEDKPAELAMRLQSSDIVNFDGDALCDYLARYQSNDGNMKASQWVRHLLADVRSVKQGDADKAQQVVMTGLASLDSFQRYVKENSNPSLKGYVNLYRMLVRISVSSLWVLVAKVWQQAHSEEHPLAKSNAVSDLFKMQVLLRIASMTNRNAIHLTRDFANKTTLADAFVFVANGLEYRSADATSSITKEMVVYVRGKLYETLVTAEFGMMRQRNFARVLLAVADFDSMGVKLAYEQVSQFEFEHVLPQAIESLQIETGDEDDGGLLDAQAEIEQILQLPENERDSLINRIGNGALLEKTSNISLGKLAPIEKLKAIDGKGMHNGYWPSHLQALRDSGGVVGQSYIEKRSQDLANKILNFVFDLSFLSIAPANTVTVSGQ